MAVLLIGEIDLTDTWFSQFIAELKKSMPNIDLRVFPDYGKLEDIEISLAWKPPLGVLAKFPNLKLVISLGAGVEHILRDPNLPQDISIVRLVSVFGDWRCAATGQSYGAFFKEDQSSQRLRLYQRLG